MSDAIPFAPPLKILKASAGSGKTFALTLHFLRLLLDRPASYREILALTFTNKATAEMKSRILEALHTLASGEAGKKAETYLGELQREFPKWTPEQIRARADQAYRNILHDYGRFSVQTIDRFSQQVIRGFTYELGLDSGFRIELNTDKVGRDLMDRLYAQLNDNPDLFDWMVGRMLRQIEEDKSWNINKALFELSRIIFSDDFRKLEEVYSRKGNEDLFERVAERSLAGIVEFEKKILHSTRLIAGIIEKSGVTADDLYYKGRNFLTKFGGYKKELGDLSVLRDGVAKLENNLDAYQSAKNRTPQIDALYEQLNPEMDRLHRMLQEKLPEYNLLKAVDENIHYLRLLRDMADLLSEWRSDNGAQLISDAQTLLAKIGRTEQGDPTFIWEKIGNRYRHFLFDEFQDTSHAQWDNLMPLLINALGSESQSNPAHLIVGDVKQSIYRWRDGDFRILLQGVEAGIAGAFHLSDSSKLIQTESLRFNYRSGRNLIEFNNFIYTHTPGKLQDIINEQAEQALKEQTQELWDQQGLHDTIIRAYKDAKQEIPPQSQDKNPGTVRIEFIGKPDDDQERSWNVADFREEACARTFAQIHEWIQQEKFKAGEIGILVRTRKEASLLIDYYKLKSAQGEMGFQVISGDALLLSGHPAIRTIVAALRFMAFESREYNSCLSEMLYYYARAKGQELEAEAWLVAGQGQIKDLDAWLPHTLIQSWEELKQMPLTTQVDRLIREFDFDTDASVLPYLITLMDTVAIYSKTQAAGLLGFLAFWEEEGAKTPLVSDVRQDAVEILTIHKSKGLEYEAVIIPFCDWNLSGKSDGQVWFDVSAIPMVSEFERIPLKFGKQVRESILIDQYYKEQLYNYMDALNALYVATTRARSCLWMLSPEIPLKKEDDDFVINNVGKLLFDVLRKEQEYDAENKVFLKGEAEAERLSPPKAEELPGNIVHLTGYRSSKLLSGLLAQKSDLEPALREKIQVSAAFSTALHELMAQLKSSESIAEAVQYLVEEGRLDVQQGEKAVQLLQQAWCHPQLGLLLSSDFRQGNEQAIIDKQGRTWRPDKVFFGEKETIVVDFKLSTSLSDPQHLTQLRGYMDFMRQMDLPGVRGYLYYFLQNEMVAVNGI